MRAPAHGRRPILSIVLAGGEGKRLLPLTLHRAKPAVSFGGEYRLIDFAISNLVNGGFRHIAVFTQYKSHSLDVHISLTWQLSTILGNYVTTVPAQMRRGRRWYLGSADALYQNLNLVDDERPEHVIVLGADHIYRFDPRQMLNAHIDSGAGVTVAAVRVPASESARFGTIARDPAGSRITSFHEKVADPPRLPGHPDQALASMGNYVFAADAFRAVLAEDAADDSSGHDIGGDLIPRMVDKEIAHVYDYADNAIPGESGSDNHYWRDVGTIDSYYEANMDLLGPLPSFTLHNDQWPIFTRGLNEPPARIVDGPDGPGEVANSILSNGATVAGGLCRNSILSRGVRVESGAEVTDSVLLGGVTVGKGARVHRAIIDKHVAVPPGYEIGFDPSGDGDRFHRSANGIVAIPKRHVIGRS